MRIIRYKLYANAEFIVQKEKRIFRQSEYALQLIERMKYIIRKE